MNLYLKKIKEAVASDLIKSCEPGYTEYYKGKDVREFYDEIYWNGLNKWLDEYEKLIKFRFPEPGNSIAKIISPGRVTATMAKNQVVFAALKELELDPKKLPDERQSGGKGVRSKVWHKIVEMKSANNFTSLDNFQAHWKLMYKSEDLKRRVAGA